MLYATGTEWQNNLAAREPRQLPGQTLVNVVDRQQPAQIPMGTQTAASHPDNRSSQDLMSSST
jgi:hypothetical protein